MRLHILQPDQSITVSALVGEYDSRQFKESLYSQGTNSTLTIYRQRNGRPYIYIMFVCLMVFSATFNNISVISWRWSVLLVKETGVPGENHRPVASH